MHKLHKDGFLTDYYYLGASYQNTYTQNRTTRLVVAIKRMHATAKTALNMNTIDNDSRKKIKQIELYSATQLLCKLCMPTWRFNLAPPKH